MDDFRKENRRLQAKVHSLSNANNTLQRKLFEYDEMHNRLLTALGFSDVAEAMDSIISESQSNSKRTENQRETIERLEEALATQLDAVKVAEISIHSISAELHQTRQELSQAMEDIERIRCERDIARKEAEKYATDARTWRMELETKLPEVQSMLRNIKQTPSAEGASTDKDLNPCRTDFFDPSESELIAGVQYEQLETRFQALLASKHKLTEKYQQDLLKWKRFKKWVVKGETTNPGTKNKKLSIRRKKSDREWQHGEGANMFYNFATGEHSRMMSILPKHTEESLTQPSEFPSSQTIHGILPSPVSRKIPPTPSSPSLPKDASGIGRASSTHLTNPFRDDSSVLTRFASTQSCPLTFAGDNQESKGRITQARVCQEYTSPLEGADSGLILVPDTPCPKGHFPSNHASYSPELGKKKRGVDSDSELGEADPTTTESPCGEATGADHSEDINHDLSRYTQLTGRGRLTANAKVHRATWSIAPELGQDGVDESVRSRNQRKTLKGGDCECCHEYYETLRPLPVGLAPPLWRSPPANTSPERKCLRQIERKPIEKKNQIEAHKNEISRHRFHSVQVTTPPNFWKIGFPDTQEIDDINRRADDMHVRKSQRIDKESKRKIT